MEQPFRTTLAQLLKARFPIVSIESHEELRALFEVRAVAGDADLVRTPRAVWTWSLTDGLRRDDGEAQGHTKDPGDALDALLRVQQPVVAVFRDLHPFLGTEGQHGDAGVVRRLRDVATAFRSGAVPRSLVLLSPVTRVPVELEKDVTVVDLPLPSELEIRAVLEGMLRANAGSPRLRIDLDDGGRERFAKAALGLTLHEAENAFARAMVNDGVLDLADLPVILEEKRQTVRKAGLLEFIETSLGLADIGGLENLKRWLGRREGAWLADAADYGLPAPRGVLITGVPGCGKSLTAKAVAAAWGIPLLRLDIGRVFAGLVGSSEHNMRSAIRTAEAVAPCVLWIDEIEKGFAPTGANDSGTSSRVFGSFLTWLQEKHRPVFVIATANEIESLPPELLRKGRFDEVFFVDLPTRAERGAIWEVHLGRWLHHPRVGGALTVDHKVLTELTTLSEGYSGAEIEHALVAAVYDAFAERRPLRQDDVVRALVNMVPLSVTQAERIAAVRAWADARAVAATAAEDWDLDTAVAPARSRPDGDGPHRPHGGRHVEF
ncbi:AAA family ATPase [Asanoa sp. NPDC050611]|uniref:AAA family ATPase n=1 Tax=Asanoa sp. NPDC050611 TaxID=3157098 RepID=UPI0033CDBCD3